MTREEADIILQLLEAGTDGNWPHVRDHMAESGYQPEKIIAVWTKLEEIAGCSGMAPTKGDF